MNTNLLTTILTRNQTFQRIKPTDGPAPLTVSFIEIKSLFEALLASEPDNYPIKEAVHLLQERGWQDTVKMLDYYEEEQEEDYQISFYRLQALIASVVNTLPQA